MKRAAAYWVYGRRELCCLACFAALNAKECVPGQVQWAEDLQPGESCAGCGKLLG